MLALLSVWLGLASLVLAVTMMAYPPAFTSVTLPLVLELGGPGTLCLAGLVLWSLRQDDSGDEAVRNQRRQAKVAIGLTLVAVAIVYVLVLGSPHTTAQPIGAAPYVAASPVGAAP